jgi:hypothetical protein
MREGFPFGLVRGVQVQSVGNLKYCLDAVETSMRRVNRGITLVDTCRYFRF